MVILAGPYEKKYDVPSCDIIRSRDARNRRHTTSALFLLLIVTLVCACFFLIVLKCSSKDERRFVTNLALYWDGEMRQLNVPDGQVIRIIVTNRNSGFNESWFLEPREVSGDELKLFETPQGRPTLPGDHVSHEDRVDSSNSTKPRDILRELLADVIGSLRPVRNEDDNNSTTFMDDLRKLFDPENGAIHGGNDSSAILDLSAAIDDGSVVYIHLIPLNISGEPSASDPGIAELESVTEKTLQTTTYPAEKNEQEQTRASLDSSEGEFPGGASGGSGEQRMNGKLEKQPATAGSLASSSGSETENFLRRISSRIQSAFHGLFR